MVFLVMMLCSADSSMVWCWNVSLFLYDVIYVCVYVLGFVIEWGLSDATSWRYFKCVVLVLFGFDLWGLLCVTGGLFFVVYSKLLLDGFMLWVEKMVEIVVWVGLVCSFFLVNCFVIFYCLLFIIYCMKVPQFFLYNFFSSIGV